MGRRAGEETLAGSTFFALLSRRPWKRPFRKAGVVPGGKGDLARPEQKGKGRFPGNPPRTGKAALSLRPVPGPAFLPKNREKALQEGGLRAEEGRGMDRPVQVRQETMKTAGRNKRVSLSALLLAAALCGTASPQAGKKPAPPKRTSPLGKETPKEKEVLERIRDNFRRNKGGRSLSANVQILLQLKNGEKIKGIVRNGRFVERDAGLDFVPADKKIPGAGLRIWYYNNTSSYIFIRYKYIRNYRIIRRLSDLQVKEIGDKIRERERREAALARKKARERIEAIKRKLEGGKVEDKLEKLAEKIKENEKEAKARLERAKLLEEFPPDEGWGPKRIQEINLRKIALHVYPNEKEKRFIQVFEDWQKAYKEAQETQKKEKTLEKALKKGK